MLNMKFSKYLQGVIFFTLLVFGCGKEKRSHQSVNQSGSSQSSYSIQIDTLELDADVFSLHGFFRITEESVVYIQSELQEVLIFDFDGSLHEQRLGPGTGPSESHGDLSYHWQLENDHHLFLGSNYDLKVFDKSFNEILSKKIVGWDRPEYELDDANMQDPRHYSYHYRDEFFIDEQWLPVTGLGKVIIPVVIGDHRNRYSSVQMNASYYFDHANMVGVIDLESGLIEHVFHRFPEAFDSYPIPYFYNYTYRFVDENKLYISDRLTSDIYVYDAFSFKLISVFGQAGKYHSGSIDRYDSYEEFVSAMSLENGLSYSYYLNLYAKNDMVFRSYHVRDFEPWGLMIYENHRLVADVRVPFRFNIIGERDGYYYADGIRDEEGERLALYRFKLVKD